MAEFKIIKVNCIRYVNDSKHPLKYIDSRLITIEDWNMIETIKEFFHFPKAVAVMIELMMPAFEKSRAKESFFIHTEFDLLPPGSYPLLIALQYGRIDIATTLVEHGASLDEKTCFSLGDLQFHDKYETQINAIKKKTSEKRKFVKPASFDRDTFFNEARLEY